MLQACFRCFSREKRGAAVNRKSCHSSENTFWVIYRCFVMTSNLYSTEIVINHLRRQGIVELERALVLLRLAIVVAYTSHIARYYWTEQSSSLTSWTIDQAKWDGASRRKILFLCASNATATRPSHTVEVNEARRMLFHPLPSNTEVFVKCRITVLQDEKRIREMKREAHSIAVYNGNSRKYTRYTRNIDIASSALYRFDLQAFHKT